MSFKTTIRRLKLGVPTLLGLKQKGFFIPYRYAHELTVPPRQNSYRALTPIFQKAEAHFLDYLEKIQSNARFLSSLGGQAPNPRFEQTWFPRLDAAMAVTMVEQHRPKHIIEIGSGHSTRFMVHTIQEKKMDTLFTSIDPAPRANLPKASFIKAYTKRLDEVDDALFTQLDENDILFIDSSHIAMPQTDINHLVNTILPLLKKGVIIHIHDIFLPDSYPKSWTWRGYNEQLLIAPLLWGNAFELLWSSHYVASRMAHKFEGHVIETLPHIDKAPESSLWLRKTITPVTP